MNKVKSVDEFLKIVFEKIVTANKGKADDPFNIFWFRGESCDFKKTSLVPTAYRNLVVKASGQKTNRKTINQKENSYFYIERNLKAEFDRKALPFILSKNIENTAWNRYFLMQHYNINTRLLDWTEDAIKALFFAIKDNTDNDAKVWILQPFELNRFIFKLIDYKINEFVIPPLSDDHCKSQELLYEDGKIRYRELTRRYLNMDFKNGKTYYPLAIYPPFLDERMTAQKACFTIFGDGSNNGLHDIIGLQEKLSDKIIDEIVIDGKSKKNMLNQLRLIGIDDSSIYPDLDGLGNALKCKYYDAYKNVEISFDK